MDGEDRDVLGAAHPEDKGLVESKLDSWPLLFLLVFFLF